MFTSRCPECYHETEREDSLKGKMIGCPKCGYSYGMDNKQSENLKKIIYNTSGLIIFPKIIGWVFAIIFFVAGLIFASSDFIDSKDKIYSIPMFVAGFVSIFAGNYIGGVIYLMVEQIKVLHEMLHDIKILKEK